MSEPTIAAVEAALNWAEIPEKKVHPPQFMEAAAKLGRFKIDSDVSYTDAAVRILAAEVRRLRKVIASRDEDGKAVCPNCSASHYAEGGNYYCPECAIRLESSGLRHHINADGTFTKP